MELQDYILKSIKDYEQGDLKFSLMNACIAIEGTARNLYKKETAGGEDYKNCLRKYYWIIEPMIGGGINLETTFNGLKIYKLNGKLVDNPDLADVIWHIFRCNDAHSKLIPLNYQILPFGDGWSQWEIGDDILKMPERIIWALLAVSVFSIANKGIKTDGSYFLSWGSKSLGLGVEHFYIKDWWGEENNFKIFLDKNNPNPVKVKIEGF